MAAPYGIQGQMLEVTVVGGYKLRDTEWISRQDPYVCLEYASSKYRTQTCKDGGKNPTFNEKFTFNLIEGLREISIQVWNSNTLTYDDFIGSGKVQLTKVLSQGYDDTAWTIQSKSGRYAGELRLILHYANANKQGYPGAAPHYPTAYPQYAPPAYPTGYAPQPYPSYPSAPSYPTPPPSYPSAPCYPSPSTPYPPATYPSTYAPPAGVYPHPYPSPAQATYPPPPAPYPGTYPPPPY